MKRLANLLFEARMLKTIPRSGYQYLGAGKESVAEHVHMMTFIALIMGKMCAGVDLARLLTMCLLHDLPESRIGDLNAVQKKYVSSGEEAAVADLAAGLPFGDELVELISEFNERRSLESRLAYDADQIAFLIDLKALADIGYRTPDKWIAHVAERIKTDIGRRLVESICTAEWDEWWLKNF